MPGRARLPIITLTTDFGSSDAYVAQMKGIILAARPNAIIVDVTHGIARHDVLAGSFALERALATFPVGTVHVAVVDPGVGTARSLIAATIAGQSVLCPDNGLITWAWRRFAEPAARELTWRPRGRYSSTFHGRDVLAPVAALIAGGAGPDNVAGKPVRPVLLDVAPAMPGALSGEVIHIDTFGNATTNVLAEHARDVRAVKIARRSVPMHNTYGDARAGQALALIGSSGLLEIAVREGSAARALPLRVGTRFGLVR